MVQLCWLTLTRPFLLNATLTERCGEGECVTLRQRTDSHLLTVKADSSLRQEVLQNKFSTQSAFKTHHLLTSRRVKTFHLGIVGLINPEKAFHCEIKF